MTNIIKRGQSVVNRWVSRRQLQSRRAAFFRQFVRKGDLCFDVGANNGDHTEVMLKLGARVVAVEPQPSCIDALQKRFGGNDAFSLVPKGLSDQAGVLTLHICEDASVISTFSQDWRQGRFKSYEWNTRVEVEVTTLDALIAEYGAPRFCKIDVEGFELQVLRGLSKPTPHLISFEFTYEYRERVKEIVNRLESLGTTAYNYTQGEHYNLISPVWLSPSELMAELSAIRDVEAWGDVYVRFRDLS